MRICVTPLGKPPSRNAEGTERSLEGVMVERHDEYQLLASGPTVAAGTTANVTNTSFSSTAKAVMGYGDLGG